MTTDEEIESFLSKHETEFDVRTNGKSRKKKTPPVGEVAFQMDVADLLIRMHGHNLRYVTGIGWLVWNGRVWERDDNERSHEAVKLVAATLRQEAAQRSGDEGERLWRIAKGIGTRKGVIDVLGLAQSDKRIRLTVDALDAKPWLLACNSGTINLMTGELQEHERDDLLTRCAPTEYDPEAQHEGFQKVLDHLIPDDEARAYMQRAAGYSLTGLPVEDVIFLLIGPPRSGKGTFLRALREALGEHYAEVGMQSFCLDRRGGGGNPARSDLFRLIGRRVVAASEIHPGLQFDTGRLKATAGGDKMHVRQLHKNEIEAVVTFTLWLIANEGDLPRIRPEDEAMWERVRRIPIGGTIPEADRDPALREGMGSEAAKSAALAWMVEGAVKWNETGLGVAPKCVTKASKDLRSEMDELGGFIAAHIVFEPGTITPKSEVRDALEAWLDGEKPPSGKRLAAALRTAGERVGVTITDSTKDRARAWKGLRVVKRHTYENGNFTELPKNALMEGF
jgi:putative DNA primase/helicase